MAWSICHGMPLLPRSDHLYRTVVAFNDTVTTRYMCSSEPQGHIPAGGESCEVATSERSVIVTQNLHGRSPLIKHLFQLFSDTGRVLTAQQPPQTRATVNHCQVRLTAEVRYVNGQPLPRLWHIQRPMTPPHGCRVNRTAHVTPVHSGPRLGTRHRRSDAPPREIQCPPDPGMAGTDVRSVCPDWTGWVSGGRGVGGCPEAVSVLYQVYFSVFCWIGA